METYGVLMLPASNRLKRKKDFERVFRNGRKFNAGCLSFRTAENGLKTSRFGFIFGKKVSKRAVIRNKVRRRLQEAVKKRLPSVKKNVDGVLVGMPGCDKYDFSAMETIILELFQKANIL